MGLVRNMANMFTLLHNMYPFHMKVSKTWCLSMLHEKFALQLPSPHKIGGPSRKMI